MRSVEKRVFYGLIGLVGAVLVVAVIVAVWTKSGSEWSCVEARVDLETPQFALVTETQVNRREFIGVPRYVIVLKQRESGSSMALLTMGAAFQEPSAEPTFESVDNGVAVYTTQYGRIAITVPKIEINKQVTVDVSPENLDESDGVFVLGGEVCRE